MNDVVFCMLLVIMFIGLMIIFSNFFISWVRLNFYSKRKEKVKRMVDVFVCNKLNYVEVSKVVVKKENVKIYFKKNSLMHVLKGENVKELQSILNVNFGIKKVDFKECFYI